MQGKNEYPEYAASIKQAFRIQRCNARKRGIEFQFSLPEWVEWWGEDWSRRGRRAHELVMARNGDTGPYHPDNVHKCTSAQNLAEAPKMTHEAQSARAKGRHAKRRAAGIASHLEVRGDGHPKSKAVVTPAGRFGSMALAADHYGITRQAMFYRLKRWPDEYRYEASQPT